MMYISNSSIDVRKKKRMLTAELETQIRERDSTVLNEIEEREKRDKDEEAAM